MNFLYWTSGSSDIFKSVFARKSYSKVRSRMDKSPTDNIKASESNNAYFTLERFDVSDIVFVDKKIHRVRCQRLCRALLSNYAPGH